MPSRHVNDYKRPLVFPNQHLETIYPALFRKVKGLPLPIKGKLETPDNDFLNYDFYDNKGEKLVIIQHGLEGDSTRPYVLGMVKAFLSDGYDVCAWNYRGCGAEMNRQPVFYHSGATDDLALMVSAFVNRYSDISLVGFSLGGNLTLKYLGEKKRPSQVKRAVAISTPFDLSAGSDNLSKPNCIIYETRFLRLLKNKIKRKASTMPDKLDATLLPRIKTLRDFDEHYTAPLHGYSSAEEYYEACSSGNFLQGIKIPTLILNALNDPFLTAESLNHDKTKQLKEVFFETTATGGHVGFTSFNPRGLYWSEERALNFCREY